MISSLRARLLFSYGVLIAVLMLLFSAGALAGLFRNPLVYASSAQRLRAAQRSINTHPELLASISADPTPQQVEQAARLFDARVIFVHTDGTVAADSQINSAPPLRALPARLKLLAQRNEIAFLRDATNRLWLVLVQPASDQYYLVLALKRPRLAILELFTNEFLRPVALAGLAGLALAVFIAWGLAQWISAPLKHIGQAADAVATGQYKPIPLFGPKEVRSLANSFNRMEQRVQDTLQSQRDLIANVSHELKTPLTSIQGFSQAILDGVLQTPDEIRQAAEVVFSEANRMNRLVQHLVNQARLEAETADFQRSRVDIGSLLRDTAEMFRPQAVQAGLQLDLDVPELPLTAGDKDRLVQVFSNLVDNAIKYTPAGGTVRISALARGSDIEIRVADTGPGIPPASRERIFQRFYRIDRSQPGVGLGLAITRQIIQAHGGAIRVEENPPHGSIFIVSLPVSTVSGHL